MADLQLLAGTTSKLIRVFIGDSGVTTSAGKGGLTTGTAGTAYYMREGAAVSVAISLSTGVTGTWSSGGFTEIDLTHMTGLYEIGLPNAAIAAGAKSVTVMVQGGTGARPAKYDIELTAVDNQNANNYGMAYLTGDPYAALVTTTYAEPSAVPAATATLKDKIGWMTALSRNKITTTATTQTLRNSTDAASIAVSTVSDDGTTGTRGAFT